MNSRRLPGRVERGDPRSARWWDKSRGRECFDEDGTHAVTTNAVIADSVRPPFDQQLLRLCKPEGNRKVAAKMGKPAAARRGIER
jgi:hypothetical protein